MFVPLLKDKIGADNVSQNETELFRNSHDEAPHNSRTPEAVCVPERRKDMENILEVARENGIPVTAFGVGSVLEGQAIPIHKGISVNFVRMNRVVDFSPEDMTITVQPGLTRLELNKLVNRHGLMFPIDPGADATLGGMVATNASGTTAVRYGVMRDQVRDLEVVLADGRIIHTGNRAAKSSSGYNLNGLFTGSEGTLGAFTELTLKVHGIPEHIVAGRATFATIKDAIEAVVSILQ